MWRKTIKQAKQMWNEEQKKTTYPNWWRRFRCWRCEIVEKIWTKELQTHQKCQKKEKRKEKQGKKTVKRCYANDTEGLPYYGKEKHEIKYWRKSQAEPHFPLSLSVFGKGANFCQSRSKVCPLFFGLFFAQSHHIRCRNLSHNFFLVISILSACSIPLN